MKSLRANQSAIRRVFSYKLYTILIYKSTTHLLHTNIKISKTSQTLKPLQNSQKKPYKNIQILHLINHILSLIYRQIVFAPPHRHFI